MFKGTETRRKSNHFSDFLPCDDGPEERGLVVVRPHVNGGREVEGEGGG